MNDKIYFDQGDVNQNKAIVIISLIFGILFFLPLVACPSSQYGKFYANQGLLLFIMSAAATLITSLPLIGWIIGGLLGIFGFISWIVIIVGAAQGRAARVPVLGFIEIIK